jgi:hypothetical protein
LSHRAGKVIHQTDSKSVPIDPFRQIKQQKDLLKMSLRWAQLNLIVCPTENILTPLNCCKVLADNSYKVFTRKIQNDPNT